MTVIRPNDIVQAGGSLWRVIATHRTHPDSARRGRLVVVPLRNQYTSRDIRTSEVTDHWSHKPL